MGLSLALLAATASHGADLVLPAPDPEASHQSILLDLTQAPPQGAVSRQGNRAGTGPPPDLQPGNAAWFREVPSISGRYSVGSTTVLPFVAAGFNGGYTERDRAMNPAAAPGTTDQLGLRSQWNQFGQGMAPNEFQMGVRIPF
jgi:hypothetical protein